MNFIVAALVLVYIALAGYGLLKLLFRNESPFSVFGWIPTSFTAGLGLLGFFGNLIMLVRLHLSFWLMGLPLVPLFIYALIKIRFKIRTADLIEGVKTIRLCEAFFLFVILCGAGSIFLRSIAFPMQWWDSRAIWGMKSKMLFGDRTIWSSNFLDQDRIQPCFRYPLLFPLAEAFIYFALGQTDDWAVMLLVSLFLPLLVMFLYEVLRIATKDREGALMGAAVLAMVPIFYITDGPAFSGYADTPLALFFLVSFGLLFLWSLSKDKRLLVAGSVLSAFLLLVKNEGGILLFLNLVWVAWPEDFTDRRNMAWKALKNTLLFLIAIVVVAGPWIFLRGNIPNVQDERLFEQLSFKLFVQNAHWIPTVFSFMVRAFVGTQPALTGRHFVWGGLWVIFILASIKVFAERKKLEARLFWIIVLFCCLVGGIYYLAPVLTGPPLGMRSFFRVMLSITPLVVLLIVMECEKLRIEVCREKKRGYAGKCEGNASAMEG